MTDNFCFPNAKPTCVELRIQDLLHDEYCYTPADQKKKSIMVDTGIVSGSILSIYPNPPGTDANQERVKATVSNLGDSSHRSLLTTDHNQRHDLSADAVRLLNRLTITRSGKGKSRLDCLRDLGVNLACKPAPSVSTTTTPTERFYRDYIGSLHQYMYHAWPHIYYQTDFAQQRKLYQTLRHALRSSTKTLTIHGQDFSTESTFEEMRLAQQQDSYCDLFQEYVTRPLAKTQHSP